MSAGNYDMDIDQGSHFEMVLTIEDEAGLVDLTGAVFNGQIRDGVASEIVIASFSNEVLDQVSLTGQVRIYLSSDDTTAIPVVQKKASARPITSYLYDIEYTVAGETYRVLQGTANVSGEVTRA